MFLPKKYTVESVTAGHPDKVCDQMSDAILDACLTQDPQSRVAVECFGAHGRLIVGGEITTTAQVDYADIVHQVYRGIGYTDELIVDIQIVQQSPDIAQGVDIGGAGDQGIMYGFATYETPELLPHGVVLAHQLARNLETLRRTNPAFTWLRPDGKTQVTMDGDRVVDVVVSTQHADDVTLEQVQHALSEELIRPVVGDVLAEHVHINPAGAWHLGGFTADTGLTGRKIMVDTYGGLLPHGGGAFSGKDATKVDRSGAYFCRYVARKIVQAGKAQQCLVSVAYAIGKVEPVMLTAYDEQGNDLSDRLSDFDFRPRAIIDQLRLCQPIFQQTAAYGHFGRAEFSWER